MTSTIDLDSAIERLRKDPPKENLLQVRVDYSVTLIFPFDEGMKFISALKKAHRVDGYGNDRKISSINEGYLEIKPINAIELEKLQLAQLLGISFNEVEAMYEAKQKASP